MGAAPMKLKKKWAPQNKKKTMGNAPFLQFHFFGAHDPGILNHESRVMGRRKFGRSYPSFWSF